MEGVLFTAETFGCKVNQYETQMMREWLGPLVAEAPPGVPADLVLINTCSVTAEADRQGRAALRRARRRHPEARIIAAGCYARRPGVDLVAEGLADAVVAAPTAEAFFAALNRPLPADPARGIRRLDGHTRAFLKVQDGCDRKCSFCVIPSIRGTSVSRPLADIVGEARALAANGTTEVVLCGVRLNAWKDPATGARLAVLLAALVELPGLARVRLSSIYPGRLEPELLDLLASHPRICPHLHLPIQSGSDAVLKAMRRGYAAADILGLAADLRARRPDLGLSADVLVGFPGETAADVDATESVLRQAGFHRLHLFPFSARPGTPAAELAPLPAAVIAARMARLGRLGAELAATSLAERVGGDEDVLLERRGPDGAWRGWTGSYHPVRLDWSGGASGQVARARITGVAGGELTGTA